MRKALSTMVVAAAVATGVLVPAAAYAAAPPNVLWGYSVEDDRGRIQLNATAEAGVAEIVVRVVEPDTEKILAEVTDFTLSSGDEHDGVWVSGEVLLDGLCSCRLDAQVTDRDGARMPFRPVGSLAYTVQMFFDQVTSTARVTYGDRAFTVSGRLLGRWPGTQAVAPVEGVGIELVTEGGSDELATSAADGSFSITAAARKPQDTATISTMFNPDRYHYSPAVAQVAGPAIEPAPAPRLTLRTDRRLLKQGDWITATGAATWKPRAQPAVNARIILTAAGEVIGSAVTGADGRYSVTGQVFTRGNVVISTRLDDPFITAVTAGPVRVTVTRR